MTPVIRTVSRTPHLAAGLSYTPRDARHRIHTSLLSSGKCRTKPQWCLLQGWGWGKGRRQVKGCRLLPHTHWEPVPSPIK